MEKYTPQLYHLVFPKRIYIKYLLAGGTAGICNLSSLALFVEVFGMHYLPGSVLAFIVGFTVSFLLQKYFTFGDTLLHRLHYQVILYFAIALANLFLNTALVYVLVDIAGLWYILAQVAASFIIAIESFILYRRFVFVRSGQQTYE